jgi:hypothetical protein
VEFFTVKYTNGSKARSGCEKDRREKRREGTRSSAGDLPTNETGVEPCGGVPRRSMRTKGPWIGVDERHVAIFSHHRRIVDTGGSLTEPSNSAHTPLTIGRSRSRDAHNKALATLTDQRSYCTYDFGWTMVVGKLLGIDRAFFNDDGKDRFL